MFSSRRLSAEMWLSAKEIIILKSMRVGITTDRQKKALPEYIIPPHFL
jgi:hypothetical protein